MPNPQQSAANASRAAIENIIGQLQQNFTNHMWLRPANRYAADTIGRLKSDTGKPSALVCADLAECVAASTPVHLLDGWAFLGRAIDASFRGDPDTSRHLGYYAELRAVMALLASEGLEIFKDRHFVIDAFAQPSMIQIGRA